MTVVVIRKDATRWTVHLWDARTFQLHSFRTVVTQRAQLDFQKSQTVDVEVLLVALEGSVNSSISIAFAGYLRYDQGALCPSLKYEINKTILKYNTYKPDSLLQA